MKVVKVGTKYRIIIPPSITDTGKRQCRFFDSQTEAAKEARRLERFGFDRAKDLDDDDLALLQLLKKRFGSDPTALIRRLDFAEKVFDVVPKEKQLGVQDVCLAFLAHHKEMANNIRTIGKYRSMARRFEEEFGPDKPLLELTEHDFEALILKRWQTPGTRRAQYANIKAFLNGALKKGYLSTDPMAQSEPIGEWGSKDEPLGVEEFRRILFVVAGLESIAPSEAPTMRYIRLLPFYVLGGFGGLRRCEIISSYPNDPVVEWSDVNWQRNWIYVRHEVAKETDRKDRSRYVTLEPVAKEWLKLVAKHSGKMVEISQSTLQRLNIELLDQLKIKVPSNGLRNGFASWAATFRSRGEVAKEMGDLESTVERFYIKRREPETGRAWFAITPSQERKIVPMVA